MNHYTTYSKKTAPISFMGQGFMTKWNRLVQVLTETDADLLIAVFMV